MSNGGLKLSRREFLGVGVSAAVLGCLTVTGCGVTPNSTAQDSSSSSSKNGPYSFAFLTNTLNNTFQSSMNDKFQEQCDNAGYSYVCLNPDYNLNTQLSQLSDAANQDLDAVFVIPVDSAGIRSGLQELKDAGKKILNVDTAVTEDDRSLIDTLIGTNAEQAGQLVGQQMVKDYPNGADIAILDFPSNESCVKRVKGFNEGLGDSASKFNIVAQQDGKATLDSSLNVAQDIIQANPNLQAFFCINDPSSLGAVAAIKAANKQGLINVYSIDASPDGKKALIDGDFKAVACQVPLGIAEKAFECAVDLMQGQSVDKEIWLDSHLISIDEAKQTEDEWQ